MAGSFRLLFLVGILSLSSCGSRYLPGFDFASFDGTPAEELASAVEQDDFVEIGIILNENEELANYQEPGFGHTVLFLAVVNHKYNAVAALLNHGADLSIKSYKDSSDVLMTLCRGYGDQKCDTTMLRLLLKYSPNLRSVHYDTQNVKVSLLSTASSYYMCLPFIRILVDSGVEINYLPNNEADDSPIASAIIQDRLDLALYYIIEKKAHVPEYCLIRSEATGPDSITVTRLLNEQDYSRDPKQQKRKEEILAYLVSVGKE